MWAGVQGLSEWTCRALNQPSVCGDGGEEAGVTEFGDWMNLGVIGSRE